MKIVLVNRILRVLFSDKYTFRRKKRFSSFIETLVSWSMCAQRIISCKCFTVTAFPSLHSSIGVMRIKKNMYMSAS